MHKTSGPFARTSIGLALIKPCLKRGRKMARGALEDAKVARDRECIKVGPICRVREDAVAARQRKLDEALAEVRATADPQADALHITPNALRAAKASAMVAICLAAGYVISLGWGLLFRSPPQTRARRPRSV